MMNQSIPECQARPTMETENNLWENSRQPARMKQESDVFKSRVKVIVKNLKCEYNCKTRKILLSHTVISLSSNFYARWSFSGSEDRFFQNIKTLRPPSFITNEVFLPTIELWPTPGTLSYERHVPTVFLLPKTCCYSQSPFPPGK